VKLELHRISVGKLAFGAQTGVSGGVLTINKDELKRVEDGSYATDKFLKLIKKPIPSYK
jgi:hypothetical protein